MSDYDYLDILYDKREAVIAGNKRMTVRDEIIDEVLDRAEYHDHVNGGFKYGVRWRGKYYTSKCTSDLVDQVADAERKLRQARKV